MPARKRRIAVVTGTRAEYGLLQSTLRAITDHPQLELQVLVAGMHLLRAFGNTLRQIEQDGWPIAARVPMQRGDDSPTDQARGLARGVAGMARAFERMKPDVVLVLGDRIEALAAALAATTTGRILAHIHGGDVAEGDFDDSVRHAITKLAHLHFPATRAAARRIVWMGESPKRVTSVGAPGLDRLRELLAERRTQSPGQSAAGRPYALVIQHAYGRPAAIEQRVMRDVLSAVASAGLDRRIIFPNTDRGHRGVLHAIADHEKRSPRGDVYVHRSLPRDEFLRCMLDARLVIGNSSCGIIEAPLAGVSSVNVGQRQAGREKGGRSIIDAGERSAAVRRAIARALRRRLPPARSGVYGAGSSGQRIAAQLAQCVLGPALRRKRLAY